MANFINNRYPWPTEDHGGANAQTGGNTRLLFAEQDNYRTRKGKSTISTSAISAVAAETDDQIDTTDVTASDSGYLGAHATDALANGAASGAAGVAGDWYYDTTLNQFKYWDATGTPAAWTHVLLETANSLVTGVSFIIRTTITQAFDNEVSVLSALVSRGIVIDSTLAYYSYLTDDSKLVQINSYSQGVYYSDLNTSITTIDLASGAVGFIGDFATDTEASTAAIVVIPDQWYYNTDDNLFKIRSGSAWVTMTSAYTKASTTFYFASSTTHGFANKKAFVQFLVDNHNDLNIADRKNYIAHLIDEVNTITIHAFSVGTSAVAGVSGTGAGDIFYVIPRVVSADISETTENIPIEFLKGSLSANKAQAGAQTYGNGFSIAASEEGMHLFLRTLCNSRNDDIIVKTRNADSTVTPKRDTLADSITHVNDGSIASVSMTEVNFTTDIVAPAVVQLSVTPTSIGDDNVLELQIDGYDHEGEELREIMLLTADDNDNVKITDFYFAQPPEGESTNYLVNTAGGTGATIDITSVDRWTEVTFNQQDSVLLPGWTVEVRKGTIPFTYVGVSPNEASIALSRDTALQMDITTIAFDSLPYTDIEGNRVDLDDGSGSEGIDIDNHQGRGDIDFVDASETLFTGWQAYLDVTEPGTATPVRVPLTDATFSINHQLDQAQLIVGDRRPGPPFRSTLRDVMLDGTILFTRERDWVRLFRNNTDFKNPVVVLRNAPAGGFPYELHIELGLGQLMSSPDPQVSDLGLITQAFNMKFRETMSGMSDDFRFKIVTDKWVFETENDTVGGLRVDGVYATESE